MAAPAPLTIDAASLDESWLNDRSEFQLNWVHGLRNKSGLHLQYHLERDLATNRHCVTALWTPGDDHVGFPGFVHGGLLSAILDDVMGRATALLKRWVVTGRLEVRYRSAAKVGNPLRVEGWMNSLDRRVVRCEGRLIHDDQIVAEATGTYVPLPAALQREMLSAWPGFADYVDHD